MYLTEQQVLHMLGVLSALCPSGRLAVNFGLGFEQKGSRRGWVGRKVMAAGGEEFRFRLAPSDAPAFMTKAGWTINEQFTGPQLRDKYLMATRLATVDVTTSGFALSATNEPGSA